MRSPACIEVGPMSSPALRCQVWVRRGVAGCGERAAFHKLQAAGACVGMRQARRTRMGFGLRSAPHPKDLSSCADINIKEYV